MFGKKKKETSSPPPGSAQSSGYPGYSGLPAFGNYVGPSASPGQAEFRFVGLSAIYPLNPRWNATYYVGVGEVQVVTPYNTTEKFRLVDLPHEQWVRLQTSDSRPIPLEIYVDHKGVSGRWLP